MTEPSASAAPAKIDQIAYWSGEGGRRWLAGETFVERSIGRFGAAALAAAAPRPGERVLDVGCGTGGTSVALAQAVGATGVVLGIDVSPPLRADARRRAEAAGTGHAAFLEADAQRHPFAPGQFDLVFSRFGVMFFPDPVAAFANIKRGAREGARMAFVCWRRLEDNPWAAIPFAAAKPHLPALLAPDPEDPGPYSFGDSARVRRILDAAGWHDIAFERIDDPVPLAPAGGLGEALQFLTCAGPTGRAMLKASEAQRERATSAIAEALTPHLGPNGDLSLTGSCWIVTSRAQPAS
jgi:SAM-dependent methyltransferase